MMKKLIVLLTIMGLMGFLAENSAEATTILYEQDFENPAAFQDNGGDINIGRVNDQYGNQSDGVTFAQNYTVETLHITGDDAWGHGYFDTSGKGENYALGMLSTEQNDLIGLSFNVGSNTFLNMSLDISSIDLCTFGGPFVSPGDVPVFQFTLYDNPNGAIGLGGGTILSRLQEAGTASDRDVFDWTSLILPLDATGNTNGNVTLRIDLLNGGYAALDNFRIAASDTAGDVGFSPAYSDTAGNVGFSLAHSDTAGNVGFSLAHSDTAGGVALSPVPEPGTVILLAAGLVGLAAFRRKHGR